ncbi:hypothetical protein AB0C59_11135 [Streptomyces sp. NPDC048664]|uniref:hypothetical protein n=1 Tax=Streptomyces sp. NPDC048664 TaxID=3154505 RepID=UPI003444275D
MPESVPVRCPACRRAHIYTAPSYPCVCGAPVTPSLDRLRGPLVVTRRTEEEAWVTVRCASCEREDQWPHPELGCPCGTVMRIPVRAPGSPREPGPGGPGPAEASDGPSAGERRTGSAAWDDRVRREAPGASDGPEPWDLPGGWDDAPAADGASGPADATSGPPRGPAPGGDAPHLPRPPAFRPLAIRTTRDAVTDAALYLRWLGYRDIRRADQRQPHGVGLAARGVLAQVDPTVGPVSLRDVECLWLTAMSESARCVYFALAGYSDAARLAADRLAVPLFVLDLTGVPRPANGPADELAAGRP